MQNAKLINDIEDTFDNLLTELSKFDGASLNEIPFEGSWTAGQATEHIIICGSGIPDSKTTGVNRAYDEREQAIRELFLNFDLKFEADPSLAPQEGVYKKDELVNKIIKIKNHLKNIPVTTDLKALCMDMEFPSFGYLTRYEWLRFILYHTQRHTHQIRNIGRYLTNAG